MYSGMRSTFRYDSMPCMTVASLEMADEPKKLKICCFLKLTNIEFVYTY